MAVDVPLPGGMRGVDLEVGDTEVRLVAPGFQRLSVPLPFKVEKDSTKARFSKSKGRLRVSLSEQC